MGKKKTLESGRPLTLSHQTQKPRAKGIGGSDTFQFSSLQGLKNCKRTGLKMTKNVTGMIKRIKGISILTGIYCTAFSARWDC